MAQTHHYLFDTATGFNDSTGSLNYTQGSGTINSLGKINQCLSWTTTSFDAAYGGGYFAGYGVSASALFWIKFSNPDHSDIIYGSNYRITIESTSSIAGNDTIRIFFIGNPLPEITIPLAYGFFSVWRHITVISDGTTYWDFYIDGSYYGSHSSSTVLSAQTTTWIGRTSGGMGMSTVFMDDLRFYNSIVSPTDVSFIYNSGIGTQADVGTSGTASGSLPVVLIYSIDGSASGGPGGASGDLTTVTVSSFAGSASAGVDASASGSLSTITVSSFSGIAYPEFIAYGSLPTITVSTLEAIPTITTSIQLDYVACDGEITWTQTLPLTGFASAVQGQDSISSRITPTIGGSGANIVFFEQRTLVASGSYTYDLTSLTDFLGGALSLSRTYAISITPTSGSISLAPGASNPFQWFFASATANILLSSPNVFMFAQPDSATITSGSKTLVVTNTSGAATATYKIAILGGR